MMRMRVVVLKRKRDSEACSISLFVSPSELQKAFIYVVSGYLRRFFGAWNIEGIEHDHKTIVRYHTNVSVIHSLGLFLVVPRQVATRRF